MPVVSVDGKRIELRNLKKLLWPRLGITKADLIEYYRLIWPLVKDFLRDRPIALKRYPDGIEEEGFFQKDVSGIKPDWLKTFHYFSESTYEWIDWPIANDLASLIWLGELATVEIHMTLSKDFKTPDILAWDLDPIPPAGLEEAKSVAKTIKEILDVIGIKAFPKLSGKRGIHILARVKNASFEETRAFAHAVGRLVAKKNPLAESEWVDKEKRQGKVFIDYLENAKQKTLALPYSPRATDTATVSIPFNWDELEEINPKDYTLSNALDWLEDHKKEPPWKDFWKTENDIGAWTRPLSKWIK